MAHIVVRRANRALDDDDTSNNIELVAVPRSMVAAVPASPTTTTAASASPTPSNTTTITATAPNPSSSDPFPHPQPDDPEESVRYDGDATLHAALREWRKLHDPPFVAGQHGPVSLPLEKALPHLPPDHVLIPSNATSLLLGGRGITSIEDRAFLARKTADEIRTGGIEPVTAWDMVSVILPAFVAVHPVTGKQRIIFDGRALNAYAKDAAGSVKYESVRDVLSIAGAAATKLDLLSAFRHVQVDDGHKPLLGFVVEGRIYRYRCLPFGLSWSPALYLMLLRPAIDAIRQHNVRLVWYVDDLIIIANDVAQLDSALERVLRVLAAHGWRAAPEKTFCTAFSVIPFLGLLVDLRGPHTVLRIPQSKATKLRDTIQAVLSAGTATVNALQGITGRISFLRIVAPELGLYRRPLDRAIASFSRLSLQTTIPILPSSSLADHLSALYSICGRLPGLECRGEFADSRARRVVYSDASAVGWGVLLLDPSGRVVNPPDGVTFDSPDGSAPRGFTVGGRFTAAECNDSSAAREIRAIAYGIEALDLRDAYLNWHSDATAAVGAIRRWSSPSPGVLAALCELFAVVRARNLSLTVSHVFRDCGLMPVADWLSRVGWRDRQAEWGFDTDDFKRVEAILGLKFTGDLFATADNTQVATNFCSRFLTDSGSRGDAFYADWTGHAWWAFPPLSQLRRVLTRLLWYDSAFPPLPSSSSPSSAASPPSQPPERSFSVALIHTTFDDANPNTPDWRTLCTKRRVRRLVLWNPPASPDRRRHRPSSAVFKDLRLQDNHGRPAPRAPPWSLELSLFRFDATP